MGKIVALNVVRDIKRNEIKKRDEAVLDYQAKVLAMDKLNLLEEMVKFQEERADKGHLTPRLISQGQVLFKALEETAETSDLRNLARSYRRHLKYELLSRERKAE